MLVSFNRTVLRSSWGGARMLRYLLILFAAFILAPAIYAEPEDEKVFEYRAVGNWSIRIDGTFGFRCFAFATYENDTALRIGTNVGGESFYFTVVDSLWRSIEAGETYPIEIEFDDFGPWDADASGIDFGGSKGLWVGQVDQDFMLEFAKAEGITVNYNGAAIANLELTESAKALVVLMECESEVESILTETGLDPFAGGETVGAGPFLEDRRPGDDPFSIGGRNK